jgi:capsular exopolysaccharide synthesis family protein
MDMQTKTFNLYKLDSQIVHDAYSLLTANIHFSNQGEAKHHSFAITSCTPCSGKTTLTINLALTMAKLGWRVLLVDADMRKPATAKRLNDQAALGLSDYLSGEANLNDTLCSTNITNLNYLSCGNNNTNPIGLLCSSRFDEFAKTVNEQYDVILFDTPALASEVDGALVAAKTDATILIAVMGETSLATMKRAKDQLEKSNANILGVVLNRLKKKDYKRYFESYSYFYNTKQFFNQKWKKKNSNTLVSKGSRKGLEL